MTPSIETVDISKSGDMRGSSRAAQRVGSFTKIALTGVDQIATPPIKWVMSSLNLKIVIFCNTTALLSVPITKINTT